MKNSIIPSFGAIAISFFAHACTSDEVQPPPRDLPTCDSGKCDGPLDVPDSEVAATPCDDVMVDLSGRNHQKIAGRLNDPIANAVLKSGTSCPTAFKDILAKLREADKAKCPDTSEGLSTRLISETGQLTGQPTAMRAVVTRECKERAEHEVFFSLFGLQPNAAALPARAEFIALDSTAGVFNYYEADGAGKINFFGNSNDMLKGKGAGQVRRCAACHTEGGLVMKELDSPWLHWEGSATIPGAPEFINRFKADLGAQNDGVNMEDLVRTGNSLWNTSKIKSLQTSTTAKELLRPLFCTQDINLGSGFTSIPQIAVQTFPSAAIVDSHLGSIFLRVSDEDYQTQITANGQFIPGVDGKNDTSFPFTHVMRSTISLDYVGQLIANGVIDQNLASDVLMVDFTRPIFSKDRCDLLEKVPNLPAADLTPSKIREALVQQLGTPAAETPAAELLASLKDTADEPVHSKKLADFNLACGAQDKKVMMANLLTVASLNRTIARGMPIIEFQETIVSDNLSVPDGTRLHPKTCELTTQFVPLQ